VKVEFPQREAYDLAAMGTTLVKLDGKLRDPPERDKFAELEEFRTSPIAEESVALSINDEQF
jgi:hypothetical protein